jgi:hypothetical protein
MTLCDHQQHPRRKHSTVSLAVSKVGLKDPFPQFVKPPPEMRHLLLLINQKASPLLNYNPTHFSAKFASSTFYGEAQKLSTGSEVARLHFSPF